MSAPLHVSPDAAFIASAAASQIVTNDHDSHADTWYDQQGIEPAGETALVSEKALQLVNSFLDQLLFNFLQCARATTLTALRPAVSDVLKPKLAKDAIFNADEELREYLGGGDEDDYVQPQGSSPRDWDVELVWKRTRLRCMVYSSLGDMEEEDEDRYMEEENLEIGADELISDVISPAVAIFLTSVLEYMGELTLTVAGQAANHRMRTKFEKDLRDGSRTLDDIADRIVVEELDMERVALDRTLGRLWRGWKKRIRSPGLTELNIRPYSRQSTEPTTPRLPLSESTLVEPKKIQEYSKDTIKEDVQPVDVPLPLGDRDVDEIEVPGLVAYSDDEDDEDEETERDTWRPKSMLISSAIFDDAIRDSVSSLKRTPVMLSRKRSNSLPTPGAVPFYTAPKLPTKELESAGESVGEESPEEDRKASYSDASSRYRDEDGTAESVGFETADETAHHSDETKEDDESVDDDGTDTPAATNRLSTVAVGVAAGAAAALSAAAAGAVAAVRGSASQSKVEEESEDDDEEEEKAEGAESIHEPPTLSSNGGPMEDISAYEAEIMMTERVSVSGSSSPRLTDTNRMSLSAVPRSSSAQSVARIVDVGTPKTSKTPSPAPDMNEQTAATSLAVPVKSYEDDIATEPEINDKANRESQASKLSLEAVRSALSNSSSNSEESLESGQVTKEYSELVESETEAAEESKKSEPRVRPRPAPVEVGTNPYRTQSQTPPGTTKSLPLPPLDENGDVSDDQPPEVPRKAPSRGVTRVDSLGMVTMEKTRTRESDDDMPLPISPRQIHTSASSHSSSTSRIKAVRTSEDNNSHSQAEDVARNFEELIQSNQTITYTLTPENMRAIDVSSLTLTRFDTANCIKQPVSPGLGSPVVTKFARKSEDNRGHNRSPSSSEPKRPPSSRAAAVLTSPFREAFAKSPLRETFGGGSKLGGSPLSGSPVSAAAPELPAPTANKRTSRIATAGPRDARVADSGTADFADFIKSTGPTKDNAPSPLRNVGYSNVSISPVSPNFSNPSRRVSNASNRHRYQPSDPSVDGGDATADALRGPANGAVPRNAQEPRTVPSMQSSINSNTALLKNNQGNAVTSLNMFDDADEEDMAPKRKSRKPRDPYEIDISDEEEDDDDLLFEMVKPVPKKEESLAEFLRNYDPPAEPQQIQANVPAKMVKKKSSAPSLMSRLRGNSGRDSSSLKSPKLPSTPSSTETRSLSSRTGPAKKYIPIQVNIPTGTSGDPYTMPGDSFSRPRPPSASMGPSVKVPMKKFEPRDAVHSSGRTNDLANFLRDSAPPPTNGSTFAMESVPEEPSGPQSRKMFGRRRK